MLHQLRYLSFSLLLLLLPLSNAMAEEKTQVDKIFARFESGVPMTREEIESNLALLSKLISTDDVTRHEKLQLLKCWDQNTENDTAIALALKNTNQALSNIPPTASPHFITDLTLCHSWFLQLSGDMDGAMEGYNLSVKRAYEHEDLKLIADSRSIRGALYSYIGDFSAALDDLVTAQDLYESLNLSGWANINLADVATSFRRYGDPQSAIRYYTKLKALYLKNNNQEQAMYVNSDIGLALDELGEHQQAVDNFLVSYQYFKEHQQEKVAATMATNIAYSLIKLNRLNEAEKYLIEADTVINEKDLTDYSFMKLFMADIKFQQARYKEALTELEQGEKAFRTLQNNRGLTQLLQLKSNIYVAMNDLSAAYGALQEFVTLTKKVDGNSLSHHTTELKVKFDTSRIESENQRLIENQNLKEQELALLEKNKSLQHIILLLAGFILTIVSIFAYKQVHRNRQLQVIALTDYLTKLPNRRHIYAQAAKYFQQALKHQSPFSVIIFDADHFKKINDNFGHELGDRALMTIANAGRALSGNKDLVGRIGGEEFLILLPNTDATGALALAHQLQNHISRLSAQNLPAELKLTVSAGVATLEPQNNTEDAYQDKDFATLLKRADNALYEAKNAGRNCLKSAKNEALREN
ncbi:MAG: GGDEF domain-containing protein [Shewanella sp.]|nr:MULTISPECIES: GGDEF domain-containing protein [unclassified Shewanella]MCU8008849.1 GGDEF domain-containing protein [Shewanella sp. SM87]MCU8033068.1 GGDEF domain-containing protein [Shewanella sp. SM71]MCU8055008.1 GGDEF domain-containing protein [Shewanella sp. SM35]MCU8063569.1 GGDEF domain-containing protein [Shewanella sp. SM34]MCU8074739.1 GGDEF domain-containing protein [Shewanella sp. SM29]